MTRHPWGRLISHYLPWLFVIGIVIAGFLLLFAPFIPTWGERHLFDATKGSVRVRQGSPIVQTFVWEYRSLDGIVLWLAPTTDREGGILLTVRNHDTNQERTTLVNLTDIPPSGTVYAPLSKPLPGSIGATGSLTIERVASTKPVYFLYQIDDAIFPHGSLQHRAGDLGFQLHYQRPALGTYTIQIFYALILIISGFVTAIVIAQSLHEPFTRVTWRDLILGSSIGIGVAIVYGLYLFSWQPWLGPGDFVKDVAYLQSSVDHLWAGQWPLWSHLTCGGLPLLANPESNTFSLATILGLFLPSQQAMLLLLALEAGIGASGVYVCARLLKLSYLGSLLAAIIALLSAPYAYKIVEGFTMIGGAIAFTPWVLAGYIAAWVYNRWWGIVMAGTALGLMFLRGDVHIIVGLIILLIVLALWSALVHKQYRTLGILSAIGCVFFLWATPKVVAYLEYPSIFTSNLHTYVVRLWHQGLLDDVFLETVSRSTKIPVLHGTEESWGNFGSYTGLIPWLLAIIGLLVRKPFRQWLFMGALITFIIGEGTLYDLVLRHTGALGVLLRIPTRIFSIFVIFLGLLAGRGLEKILAPLPRWGKSVVGIGVIGLVTINLAGATTSVLHNNIVRGTPASLSTPPAPTLAAHETTIPERHPSVLLQHGYLLPQLCADLNTGHDFVTSLPTRSSLASVPVHLTPNTITLSVDSTPQDVSIYSNFTPLWVSPVPILENDDGSLHVLVPPSAPSKIQMRYSSGLVRVEQAVLLLCLLGIGLTTLFRIAKQFVGDRHQPDQPASPDTPLAESQAHPSA